MKIFRQVLGIGHKVPRAAGSKVLRTDSAGRLAEGTVGSADLDNGSVGLAKLADLSSGGVVGRGSGSGAAQLLSPASDGQVLKRASGAVGFGGLVTSDLPTVSQAEEGTWTPEISCLTPGDLSVVYSIQTGRFRRSGSLVSVQFYVQGVVTYTTAAGRIQIMGLPYVVPVQGSNGVPGGVFSFASGFTPPAGVDLPMLTAGNTSYLIVGYRTITGTTSQALITSGATGNTFTLAGSYHYMK